MFGILALVGLGLTAFLVNKGKGAQNLTFGMSFKNFGIDSVSLNGFVFNILVAVDNASNQTYTISDGKFTLRYPNDQFSMAGQAVFKGKTTVEPRSNSEISVKISINAISMFKILKEFIRIRKAGGYIMKAGVVGTVAVLDMPSININQEINLFEYINNVYEDFSFVFDFIFGKMKKDKTTSQGTDNGRNTEVSTNTPNSLVKPKQNNTPSDTQKYLVDKGKQQSKWFATKPKL